MNEPRPRQDDLRSIEHPGLSPAPDLEWLLPRLLATVRCVSDELRPQARLAATLGLDHSLERDYGLDSLARVELIARVDRDLGVALGEAALTEAETPRDLLRFITRTGGRAADTAGPVEPRSTQQPPVADTAPESYPPDAVQTLVAVFEWHLQRHPDRVLITLYENGDQPVDLSYADLHRDALALAAGLRALGLDRGDKVAIMLPTGREFFAAFFGALVAGAVPVPLYPPARPSQLEDHLKRITGIMRNAQARVLVTVERAKPLAHLLRAQVETLQTVGTVADLSLADSPAAPAELAASDIAFLQYTSGSTGDPKGVILTHANLLANLRAMWRASKVSSTDTFVSWLPLYHDMGLIGACLGALVLGFHLVLMSPLAFLARPARWLETIHRYRGTVSAAPNFAYELCLAKVSDADLARLDLSSWRLAFNGAEPVSPDTLERFAARFAPCGLKREALTPVYGLAESTVGLAFPPVGRGPWIDRVDRATLARDGVAAKARPDDAQPLRIVSCGLPLPGHEMRVIDAGGRELPERAQGRVQFRGPSSTQGYLNNPVANQGLFDGAWLNTGDLGYMAAGELFLTGREKDIIIRGGFNIHPQELETAVADIAGIRKGGVAVFAASDPRSGTERLVVLAETRVRDPVQRQQMAQAITALSATLLGAPADDVVLAPPRSVLKTSSGKTRRAACRELYEQGRLGVTQRAPWRQWAALAATAAAARARRAWRSGGRLAWGLWAWAVFCALAALALCAVLVVPGLDRRRRAARALTLGAIRLIGLPVRMEGLDRLPPGRPLIVVANHASYVDSILLGAVLPAEFSFAAKRELADVPLIGPALRRLGIAFVERFDATQGVEDTRSLEARVRAGESMVFFPEGTLRRASGLQPFKLGAFVIAAETGTPLVPVTLNGTRSLLRDQAWLPQRGDVRVTIGEPIPPAGPGWDHALELRDAARKAMAAGLSETTLDV
ncbi:MAG: AMP-binding protein [Polaromonas sp.]|uniref:AMP-binding protein n=1 Tax=Polaromonas sp. TaxID=1869339 RepID=UPI002733EC6B|nr:AMP-binding protein [Polaromonas sp.]MDP3246512.1 AMP-binding protein [Polaromonas sp.]MDP3755519.1 AMP-binding protein [Polaromonas sp.]